MKYLAKYLSIIVLLTGILTSCSSDKDPDPNPKPGEYTPKAPEKSTLNTVLLYFSTDCGFAAEVPVKVRELTKNWDKNYDGNLLVYADEGEYRKAGAYLLHIYTDQYGNNQADTVRKYPAQNSADWKVVNGIMKDVYKTWPAANKGLLALSHASGWLPDGALRSMNSRSVMMDNSNELDLWDFAKAIPYKLDYVIFDACMMAGVEVAYELRNKAENLIVSPAEVIVNEVFIYPTLMSRLMKQTPDLKGVTDDFYNSFVNKGQYVTVNLINTAGMDKLAKVSKKILSGTNPLPTEGLDYPHINTLQKFYPKFPLYFDFGQYMEQLASGDDQLTDEFLDALDQCVIYKKHTPYYFSAASGHYGKHLISHYSGMTTYIPQAEYDELNQAYKDNLQWSKYIWGN